MLDGAIIASPEGGGGSGTNSLNYQPGSEAPKEFKIQNNSYSAEYGSNGGTSVIMVTKWARIIFTAAATRSTAGRNCRPIDFYWNLAGQPKTTAYRRDQQGVDRGPIIKQKTFFFDHDRIRFHSAAPIRGSVPTALERTADFSKTFNPDGTPVNIYNPKFGASGIRREWQHRGLPAGPFSNNVIPPKMIDLVPAKVVTPRHGGLAR